MVAGGRSANFRGVGVRAKSNRNTYIARALESSILVLARASVPRFIDFVATSTDVCINFPRFFSRAHQPGRRRGNENTSANADDDDSWTSSDQRTGLRCSFLRFHEARTLLFNDRQQQFVFLSILLRESEETRIYAPGIITLRLKSSISVPLKCVLILGCRDSTDRLANLNENRGVIR